METELEHARTARVHNPSTQGAFFLEAVALAALARVDEVRNLMAEARTHGDAFNQGLLHR
ncbi:MAG: hypothetical protein HKO65_03585, partial [Gemmatimonadetes bacterium]|nr:hypothetical protein [Gemmatimonadota bacterium]